MEKLHTKEVDNLFEAILSLKTIDECYKFFEDICTVKEILDISQRLKAAKMLKNGANYMAKSGSNHEEILKHYYSGVEITLLD